MADYATSAQQKRFTGRIVTGFSTEPKLYFCIGEDDLLEWLGNVLEAHLPLRLTDTMSDTVGPRIVGPHVEHVEVVLTAEFYLPSGQPGVAAKAVSLEELDALREVTLG